MKVAVTGATGFVGGHLCAMLQERGHSVVALTRDPARAPRGTEARRWDGRDAAALAGAVADCQAIVNLAGENVFGRRWNDAFREAIRASRVDATRACVAACREGMRVLVNASAIGFYGPRGPEPLDEDAPWGAGDFLAGVCREWETEAAKAEAFGARVAILRFGVVLGKDGGALAKMLPPFRAGVGGPVGSGDQYVSWVHIDDVCGATVKALEDPTWRGPFNVTAPGAVTNREFAKALGKALHRPSFVPTPAFALKLAFGDVAEVLTGGQNVVPKRALAGGYVFRYPQLEPALKNLVG